MILTTDDIWQANLRYFKHWKIVKEAKPDIKLIAFVVANYNNEGEINKSEEFNKWYEENKDWVEIGVHGYDHLKPQEGWRSREEQKENFGKAIEILKPYLPDKFLVRFPGFRFLPYSEKIVRELGASGVAHQEVIKYFNGELIQPVFNTHCCDGDPNIIVNPITKVWKNLIM